MQHDPLALPDLPIPSPDDPVSSAEHWGWLRQHELRLQTCTLCRATRNPPTPVCHVCYDASFEWTPIPTTGSVVTWTRVWHAIGENMRNHVPYLLAWIEIDHPDQPRFLGNLVGDPMQDVRIGDRVVGVFEDRSTGTLLNWRLIDTATAEPAPDPQ